MLKSSLLVDDLQLVSLLEAQVAVMLGLVAVYGHHQVVCEADIAKLISNTNIKVIWNMRKIS